VLVHEHEAQILGGDRAGHADDAGHRRLLGGRQLAYDILPPPSTSR
jgi:hypothetical protein